MPYPSPQQSPSFNLQDTITVTDALLADRARYEFRVLAPFAGYIIGRRGIELQKEAGVPWPHGCSIRALIYRRYCCVDREDDTGTRWWAENWRTPHEYDEHLWFASGIRIRATHRLEVLERLGWPVPWDERHFIATLKSFPPHQRYGNAFTVPPFGRGPKVEGLALLFSLLWKDRERLRYKPGERLRSFYDRLVKAPGLDSFFSGQIIADCKHSPLYRVADDWDTFVCRGPGSERGLSIIVGRPIDTEWSDTDFSDAVHALRDETRPALAAAGIALDAQGIQHNLCEFHKFEKFKSTGRTRRPYRGSPS